MLLSLIMPLGTRPFFSAYQEGGPLRRYMLRMLVRRRELRCKASHSCLLIYASRNVSERLTGPVCDVVCNFNIYQGP
jgi:hypothetical protein